MRQRKKPAPKRDTNRRKPTARKPGPPHLRSYAEEDVHVGAPPPTDQHVSEVREQIVRSLAAFVAVYRKAQPLADDFLRRFDRCTLLRTSWASERDRAVGDAVCEALFDAWEYDARQRVALIEPTSAKGKRLLKEAKKRRKSAAELRQQGSPTADTVEREAQDIERQVAAPRGRGHPEQNRVVFCLDRRLAALADEARRLAGIPEDTRRLMDTLFRTEEARRRAAMGTLARWRRIAEIMSACTRGHWTVNRVKTAIARIQDADEKWRHAVTARHGNRPVTG